MCSRCLVSAIAFHDCPVLALSARSNLSTLSHSPMPPIYTSHILNSNKCGIRIAHINARSLVSIADEISHLLLDEKIDILAITET